MAASSVACLLALLVCCSGCLPLVLLSRLLPQPQRSLTTTTLACHHPSTPHYTTTPELHTHSPLFSPLSLSLVAY